MGLHHLAAGDQAIVGDGLQGTGDRRCLLSHLVKLHREDLGAEGELEAHRHQRQPGLAGPDQGAGGPLDRRLQAFRPLGPLEGPEREVPRADHYPGIWGLWPGLAGQRRRAKARQTSSNDQDCGKGGQS